MILQSILEKLKSKAGAPKTDAHAAQAATPLSQLRNSVSVPDYAPMTEDEIRARAEAQYQTAYDRQVQAARDAHDTGELAYDRQLSQIQDSYARQAQDAQALTAQGVSEVDRRALSRGMQRSSYNNATLANMRLAGNAAALAIGEAQTRAESDLMAERALAERQFANSLALLRSEYDTNVSLYADTLRAREWERATDATRYGNELALALAEYESKLAQQRTEQERWLQEQENWLKQYNEDVRRYELENPARTTGTQGAATTAESTKVFRIR